MTSNAIPASSRRLAVLGWPIEHSHSPALHRAAYRVLGLPWEYSAVPAPPGSLSDFLDTLDREWLGLSLTMPMKREVLPLLTSRDALVEATGVANTVLLRFEDGVRCIRGYNTDVHGLMAAIHRAGARRLSRVHILGGGATAVSALAAVARLGAGSALLAVRNPARAAEPQRLGQRLGLAVEVCRLDELGGVPGAPDLVISTIPNDTDARIGYPAATMAAVPLVDVAYHPWPTVVAAQWLDAGGQAVSGLEMLIHQAIAQIRIFTSGDAELPLPREDAVLREMRSAVE